jgi:hypothetical protein
MVKCTEIDSKTAKVRLSRKEALIEREAAGGAAQA